MRNHRASTQAPTAEGVIPTESLLEGPPPGILELGSRIPPMRPGRSLPGGAGTQSPVPERRGWEAESGGPGNGVWVPGWPEAGRGRDRRAGSPGLGGGSGARIPGAGGARALGRKCWVPASRLEYLGWGVWIPGSPGVERAGGGGRAPETRERRGLGARAWTPPGEGHWGWVGSPRPPRGARPPTGPSPRSPAGVISRIGAAGSGLPGRVLSPGPAARPRGPAPSPYLRAIRLSAPFFLPRGRPSADGSGGEARHAL